MLRVENLRVCFPAAPQPTVAVQRASFSIAPGEIVGLSGPSGCGKTVLSTCLLGMLEPPGYVAGGSASFETGGRATNLLALEEKQWRGMRGSLISMVFQDPFSALNPNRRVGGQFVDAIRAHAPATPKADCLQQAAALLGQMRFDEPAGILRAYPFELSGGMCQRVVIAMALAHSPRLLIADEPTTALDVKSQATILQIFAQLRKEHGTAILLISHDAAVVASVADRLIQMRDGVTLNEGVSTGKP